MINTPHLLVLLDFLDPFFGLMVDEAMMSSSSSSGVLHLVSLHSVQLRVRSGVFYGINDERTEYR